MRIARHEARKHASRHGEAAILFAVGSCTFAIAATDVEEIREFQGLTPVPNAGLRLPVSKVRHVLHRDRRSHLVVDASFHFHMLPSHPTRLLLLRNREVALTADTIDRMTELTAIAALPRAFRGEERRWYRGLAIVDGRVVPVLNPDAVLTAAEAEQTRAALAAGKAEGASA